MTSEEQLREWVAGNPQHNKYMDECCPDFSCCNGGKMADLETRKRFQRAVLEDDEETQHMMLMMFLASAFPSAHIAGNDGGGHR